MSRIINYVDNFTKGRTTKPCTLWMKFWTTRYSNFLIKLVSFWRKNSHNFFDTNYNCINLLQISYYDKVSKYWIAKIGDFGRVGRLEFLCSKMFSNWHQHFKILSKFKICQILKRFNYILWSKFFILS